MLAKLGIVDAAMVIDDKSRAAVFANHQIRLIAMHIPNSAKRIRVGIEKFMRAYSNKMAIRSASRR
ncbi:MAG: hypothetical protein CBE20_07735 [Gammaproteobacteria bacterium TMED260]|nr:hypothetical protein [Gammaproteobacteria bacterium]OUX32527.1 MAG: hypothetical protein CBE20_07735 [Gammaproteobacteria bacterium TMED260]